MTIPLTVKKRSLLIASDCDGRETPPRPQLSSILTVVDQEAELLDHGQVPGDPVEAVTVQPCNTHRGDFQPRLLPGCRGIYLTSAFTP